MRVVHKDNQKLILKEITSGVLYKTIPLFLAGILITINSAMNHSEVKMISFFIGPILMVIAFLIAIYSFKLITIVIDLGNETILRIIRKSNKVTSEKIQLINIKNLVIVPKAKLIGDMSKPKNDLYIEYEDGDNIVLNLDEMKLKKAVQIGYAISSFLNVPMKRLK